MSSPNSADAASSVWIFRLAAIALASARLASDPVRRSSTTSTA